MPSIHKAITRCSRPLHGFSLNSFWGRPTTLQMGSFQLKNGWKLNTYGEYDANGRRVYNPSALPWERNNFNGAIRAEIGKWASASVLRCNKETEHLFIKRHNNHKRDGASSPFSFRYAWTISKRTSPYLSTPFLPTYGMRRSISLSTGSRLLMPKMAFCWNIV